MAPSHSFLYLLSLVLTYLTPFVLGAPWIATDYYQEVKEVVYDYSDYDTSKHRYAIVTTTTYQEIIPTATSLPDPIQTNVVVNSDYGFEATIVEKLYPSGGVGKPVPYSAVYNVADSAWTSIIWVVNLTYSAPTGCSTQWTTTTAATVTPPVDYTFDRLLPSTAVSTSYSVTNAEGFQSSTYVYKYIWVEPTQVPTTSMNSLKDQNYPSTLYNYDDKKCRYQSSVYPNYDYPDSYYDDDYGMGISWVAIILICVLGWIGLWFLFGILEAWIRFRRLMNGWQARRGMPVCWALTIMPLTLFCLCCLRKGYRSRNAHDAAVLQSRWKKLSAWKKFVLFLKWGFRYSYPTILGPAPERVSKKPGMNLGQPNGPPLPYPNAPPNVMYPPGAPGPQMRQVDPRHLGQASTLQPIPEASGALQREVEQAHEQAHSQTEIPREPHTETETVTETRAQAQTEAQPETQTHQSKPAHDADIGRAQ
ncbi:hypothetical protein F1880_009739 [Penicillium rolfsii]|nr:hypothetical protein F1880_009739 [Penicillium rolfsii]